MKKRKANQNSYSKNNSKYSHYIEIYIEPSGNLLIENTNSKIYDLLRKIGINEKNKLSLYCG